MEETSKKIQVGKIRIRFFNFYAVICQRFQRPSFNDFIKIYSAPVWFSFSPLPPPSISLSFSLSLSLVSLFPWFSRCFPKRAPETEVVRNWMAAVSSSEQRMPAISYSYSFYKVLGLRCLCIRSSEISIPEATIQLAM